MLLPSDIGVAPSAQSFSIRRHDSLLDAVVNHLDEMPGAVWTAVQITLLRRAAEFLASRRTCDVTDARGQSGEDGIYSLNHCRLAADHHAVAALQSPHAAARSDIGVAHSLRR